jgi:hypothetical protein
MNWSFAPLAYIILFPKVIVNVTIAVEDAVVCPPIYRKGILHMPFKVVFLNAEDDKLIVTSFTNSGEPDAVAVISKFRRSISTNSTTRSIPRRRPVLVHQRIRLELEVKASAPAKTSALPLSGLMKLPSLPVAFFTVSRATSSWFLKDS